MLLDEAINKLEACKQKQLLRFYNELDPEKQNMLLSQIEATDFSVVRNDKD